MEELQTAITENLKYQKKIKRHKYTKPILFNIIDHFISSNQLICYGGIAINTIIPKERFYDEVDIPDYDCFTKNAIKDAKELAIQLSKYETVEVKAAMFKGTYKIFVNSIPMIDFTHIENDLFDKIKYESLVINNIHYAPPNYLRMNIHLELSRPLGDVSRWEKIYNRLDLLNKYHPFIYNKNIINIEVKHPTIYNKLIEKCKKWVIFGEYAMKYFNLPKKYNVSNSNIFILAESLEDVKVELNQNNDLRNYKIKSYSNKFINNFYEFSFNDEPLLYVFITNSCQSYNEIKENDKIIKIANIDTLLMIYYALSFIQPPSLNINNLLVYCYLLQNMNNKSKFSKFSKFNKLTKRFSLPCVGIQPTFEDIRRERDNMYKKYKKTKSKKIYNDYFYQFIPKQTRKRI
uniref:Poly(A) polymerase catalytic subunit domain-containing protein n=1 Tax=viral metagenome TaxID=1070528 RepID=A0A6C0ES38_9ZZZZ